MCGAGVIEEIERYIAAISTLDGQPLPADELGDACVAITRLVNVALVRASSLLAEFQQRGNWIDDGALSAATWVANRTGQRRNELAGWTRVGTALHQVPTVEAAAAGGEITFDHAHRIADCVRKHPQLAARDEAILLESARAIDADMFRMVARHWNE
jgi:hypothetical protein